MAFLAAAVVGVRVTSCRWSGVTIIRRENGLKPRNMPLLQLDLMILKRHRAMNAEGPQPYINAIPSGGEKGRRCSPTLEAGRRMVVVKP